MQRFSYTKEIEIPILPHLKKFLRKRYPNEDPIKVSFHRTLGVAFDSAISQKLKPDTKYIDRYTERQKFLLCASIAKKATRKPYLIAFNIVYDRSFKEFLYQWVECQNSRDIGMPVTEAIKNFLNYYNIKESEYSYDSAYRMWTRYQSKDYS